MTTNRFQPGDKVRAGIFTADIGLTPNRVYTVHHVDDFGQVQPNTDRHHHYHPSHFELVMRAVADEPTGQADHHEPSPESYCLKDGEGDWWVYDAPSSLWLCETHSGGLPRGEFEAGIESIEDSFGGIDGTPTAPETYCLKDRDGDWWFSEDGETFRWACTCCADGSIPTTLDQLLTGMAEGGIDAEPIPAMKGMEPTHAEVDEVQNWPTDDGGEYETEMALAYEEPGNSTGPSLRFEAALAVGDRVEYVGGGEVETKDLIGKLGTVVKVGGYEPDDIRVEWDDRDATPPGVLAANLRKADPIPLQPGDWVKVLARVEHVYESNGSVKAQTFQSDGSSNGLVYAVASAITRTDEVPEWAVETKPEEPTGLGAVVRVRHDVYEWARAVRTDATGRLPWYYADSSGNGGNRDWAHLDAVEVLSEGVEVTER